MNEQRQQLENHSEFVDAAQSRHRNGEANSLDSGDGERRETDTDGRYAVENPASTNWTANVGGERTLVRMQLFLARSSTALLGRGTDSVSKTFLPLHISPTPIREALGRLETAGLAEHVPHRGSRVSDVSATELRDLYELRLILEPLAASKAAERFSVEANTPGGTSID